MGVQAIYVEADHIDELIRNVRDMDRREMWALARLKPEDAIPASVERSASASRAVVNDDGDLLCIFGICPTAILGNAGAPWMIGTDLLQEYRRDLVVRSRAFVRYSLRSFDKLSNVVWAENTVSIRYLKAIGFTVGEEKTSRITGARYHEFWASSLGSIDNV